MAERIFELKKGQTEYPDAFDGVKVSIPFPSLGTDPDATLTLTGPDAETVANMIADAHGDVKAMCSTYCSARILAGQKNVKAAAGGKEVEALLKAEDMEAAVDKLVAAANAPANITIREFSTGGTKRASAKVKAKAEIKAEATAKLADLSDEERAAAEALLAKLGLA